MNSLKDAETTPATHAPTQQASRAAVARKTLQHSNEAQAIFGLTALFLVAGLTFGVLAVALC